MCDSFTSFANGNNLLLARERGSPCCEVQGETNRCNVAKVSFSGSLFAKNTRPSSFLSALPIRSTCFPGNVANRTKDNFASIYTECKLLHPAPLARIDRLTFFLRRATHEWTLVPDVYTRLPNIFFARAATEAVSLLCVQSQRTLCRLWKFAKRLRAFANCETPECDRKFPDVVSRHRERDGPARKVAGTTTQTRNESLREILLGDSRRIRRSFETMVGVVWASNDKIDVRLTSFTAPRGSVLNDLSDS